MTVATAEPSVRPIPEGFHTITPSLTVHAAAEAIEFYKRAFGAEELYRAATPDGQKILHATLRIGDSPVMLNDEFPEMSCQGPRAFGGSPSSLHLYVEDADALFARAVAAGATVSMPICDALWGDRYGRVTDPFGYDWAIATQRRRVSEDELKRAAEEMAACVSEPGQGS
jgi:uncharacterized glyoxalase superfamily protein PhnB